MKKEKEKKFSVARVDSMCQWCVNVQDWNKTGIKVKSNVQMYKPMEKWKKSNGGTLLLLFALNETKLSNFLYILRRLAISKC